MADRDFESEGMKTHRDRFRFSNDFARKIYGPLNRETEMNIEANTENEYYEKLYATTIEFIQRETAIAWGNRDTDWREDLKVVMDTLIPMYARKPDWLKERLETAARRTWNTLVEHKKTASQTIADEEKQFSRAYEKLLWHGTLFERWNTAHRNLPAGVDHLIEQLLQQKGRNIDFLTKQIEFMQREPSEVDFTANTVYTAKLEAHVNTNAWLKDINDLLIANKCDPATRGKYWSTLLLK